MQTAIKTLLVLLACCPLFMGQNLVAQPSSSQKAWDLLHVDASLKIDVPTESIVGEATLSLTPYPYQSDSLMVLDAKGFTSLEVTNSNRTPLLFQYNGTQITLNLHKLVLTGEKVTVLLKYRLQPSLNLIITDSLDAGVFFINSQKKLSNVPQQVWTQGETSWSSCWLPCIDRTDEKFTQTLHLTVEKRFTTISNGKKTSTKANSDGTHTDTWQQDVPMAAYLSSFAIGEFECITQMWEGVEVSYYVEPQYREQAKKVFEKTPQMLSFFSKILGVKYPYPKYAQVVVRGFVAGAMENTTCSTFGNFMNQDNNLHNDVNRAYIIAHELFHQWFGDLVTAENWGNLFVNESFATYGEYLWYKETYGKVVADHYFDTELRDYYLNDNPSHSLSVVNELEPNPEQMFAKQGKLSYEKGACVLRMLHNELGDDIFFKALNHYLTNNAYKNGDVTTLRLSFEIVSGRDLSPFFKQWFEGVGQPNLEIAHNFKSYKSTGSISIKQLTQTPFNFSVKVRIIGTDNSESFSTLKITKPFEVFEVSTETGAGIKNVLFDEGGALLCFKKEAKSMAAWQYQFNTLNYPHNIEALRYLLQDSLIFQKSSSLILAKLSDKEWVTRLAVIDSAFAHLEWLEKNQIEALLSHYDNETNLTVKSALLNNIEAQWEFLSANNWQKNIQPIITKALTEESYKCQSKSLKLLAKIDKSLAITQAETFSKSAISPILIEACNGILLKPGKIDVAMANLERIGYTRNDTLPIAQLGKFLVDNAQELSLPQLEKVTHFLMLHAAYDPNFKVRAVCVQQLAASKYNLPSSIQEKIRASARECLTHENHQRVLKALEKLFFN